MLTHSEVWRAIDRLAARHSLSASGLARRAGLDPTTFNKSKRITREGKQRWPSTESLSKVLAATGASLGDFVVLVSDQQAAGMSHSLPMIGFDQAGQGALFNTDGQPVGDSWDGMLFPQLTDPAAFALEVGNDSLVPVYREGDVLVLSPRANLRRGDRVVLKLRDGQVMAGQLVRKGVRRVQLAPISGGQPDRTLETHQLAWMSRILWASQ